MKVKIRDTVGMYQRPGKLWEVYYPGDIIEVSESEFYSDIMTKIDEPKKEKPKHTGGPPVEFRKDYDNALEPSATETEVTITAEGPPVSEEPKPKRRRRKPQS